MKSSTSIAHVIGAIAKARGLDLTKVGSHTRIDNPPWLALSIEVIGPHLVSVAHYGEQHGDLMADPECVYYTNTTDGSWIPVSYRNDYVGSYRAACTVAGGEIVSFRLGELADQCAFAGVWASNLRQQGFLEAAKRHEGAGE